jgi:ferric-dicitrate binding protein FerR (iron transport regulator)
VVRVVVAAGRVLLRPDAGPDGTGTVLERNDKGELDRSGRTTVWRGVDAGKYIGWIGGELRFERAPLAWVLRELGRAYDVEIVLSDPRAGAVPVTAIFRPAPAEEIARTLAALLDMRHRRDGERVRLEPIPARR